jgi:site-specific recombinase
VADIQEEFIGRRAEQRIEEIWDLETSNPALAERRARAYRHWLRSLRPTTADEKAYFDLLAELADELLRRLRAGRR